MTGKAKADSGDGRIDYRQLSKEEKALNYTKNAEDLKQALADTHQNLSKQVVDNIFESTQKGMVNSMDNYMMNLQVNTTYKNQKEDIEFVSQEAKLYFSEAAKDKVYTDRNTLTNRPMMDTNNYKDSTYNPASNSKIVKDTTTSLVRTGLGLVANPVIATTAWFTDTVINADNTNSNDIYYDMAPSALGNPALPEKIQKTGAGLSIINTVKSVFDYSETVDKLEQERDKINNGITNDK